MTFRRVQAGRQKRVARSIDTFEGRNGGAGRTDQADKHADVYDADFLNHEMELRPGKRKNSTTGRTSSIASIFQMEVGQDSFLGVVAGGILSVAGVNDVVDGSDG